MITVIFLTGTNSRRFELLKELRPQASTFGLLMNASNRADRVVE
jgi:hypothetical protein